MISGSLPTTRIRSASIPASDTAQDAPDTPTAEQMLDSLDALTLHGDTAGIRALLQDHPTVFATGAPRPWCVAADAPIDLQTLFDTLDLATSLPAIRLEGFEWGPDTVCSSLLCHPGLQDLTLHDCMLTPDAWTAVAVRGEAVFPEHPPLLKRLAFTFPAPDRSALQEPSVVSSQSMARWVKQLKQLDDLTLSGFHRRTHAFHMSYSDVLAAVGGRLRRLALLGFLPMAFSSPRIHRSLQGVACEDRDPSQGHPEDPAPGVQAPFCLSMRGWIWPVPGAMPHHGVAMPVNEQAEQTLRQWVGALSSHLTLELQDMGQAEPLVWQLGLELRARTADVSLRLNCPVDASLQEQLPACCELTVLNAIPVGGSLAWPALKGLHLQLTDHDPAPVSVLRLKDCTPGLKTMTVALRTTRHGLLECVRQVDREMCTLLEQTPSLVSLDIRSPYRLQYLMALQDRLEARGRLQV